MDSPKGVPESIYPIGFPKGGPRKIAPQRGPQRTSQSCRAERIPQWAPQVFPLEVVPSRSLQGGTISRSLTGVLSGGSTKLFHLRAVHTVGSRKRIHLRRSLNSFSLGGSTQGVPLLAFPSFFLRGSLRGVLLGASLSS
jgi:hypothetical protein